MNVEKGVNITVQGLGTPVPAAESEQAGNQASRPSNCNGNENTTSVINSDGTSTPQSLNPFGRSSVISRTPPVNQAHNITSGEEIHERNGDNGDMVNKYQEAYKHLGKKILELAKFVKEKKNIHHQIKDLIRSIRIAYNKTTEYSEAGGMPYVTKDTNDAQTSPLVQKSTTSKRLRGNSSPEDILLHEKARGKKARANDVRIDDIAKTTPTTSKRSIANMENKTPVPIRESKQRVPTATPKTPRKRKRKKGSSTRPDVFIIKQTGDKSYAEMLKQIKESEDLKELGSKVQKIRRTQAGELLIVMDKGASDKTTEFRSALTNTLEKVAEIKCRTHELLLEVRDLDEISTKEEIIRAIQEQVDTTVSVNSDSIKSLRKSYNYTQSALISLPVTLARAVLEKGKLRIGWVICRVREKVYPSKCFKCWQTGHQARNCKSTTDRSKNCRKCGETGHFAKNCTNEFKCFLCSEKGLQSTAHMPGSRRCPSAESTLDDHGS